jgi:hypothetical protein
MTSLKDNPNLVHLNLSKNSMFSIMKCLGTGLLKFKGKKGRSVWIGLKKSKEKKERNNPNCKSPISLTKNISKPTKKMIKIAIMIGITKETDIQQIVMSGTNKKGMILQNGNILHHTKNIKNPNLAENTPDQLLIQGHPHPRVPDQREAEPEIKRNIGMKTVSKESHTENKASMVRKTKD